MQSFIFDYQRFGSYFAQVADDLKDIAEKELQSLGASHTKPAYRGISFKADTKTLYRTNLESRLVNRVLAPLMSFDCHSDRYLYNRSLQVPWERILAPTSTFAVFASVSNSSIRHSRFAALRLKDSIVDYFKYRTGKRPSIDRKNPHIWFNLHIHNNRATISLDTSGGSLHRRGYRKKSVEAPMIETLAAAIIQHSGWDCAVPLHDPFCGSGTILCEAFLFATRTPPGILRKRFGFERLPGFDIRLWDQVKREALNRVGSLPKGIIKGSDISRKSIMAASHNCAMIDRENIIDIEKKDVFDYKNMASKTIICNPPYGIRMGNKKDLEEFYKRLGDFLKQRCTGSTAYIYFGERKYIKNVGLKPSWKKPLSNGGLDGRLVKYEMY